MPFKSEEEYISYQRERIRKRVEILKRKGAINMRRYRKPYYTKCIICGNPLSDYKKKFLKFCSEKCRDEGLKIVNIRRTSKHEKSYGFNICWRPKIIIEPMEYHHINMNDVVLIPKSLHRSFYHNLRTNQNMFKMNALVLSYIFFTPELILNS